MVLRSKRGGRTPDAEDLDHSGFYPYLQHYLQHLDNLGLRPDNINRTNSILRRFIRWCDERGLQQPQDITLPILERYQRYLSLYRKPDGHPLGITTQHNFLTVLKRFFKWLTRQHHILYNPAAELELPRMPKRIPRVILRIDEIEDVLNQPDTNTLQGIRDRTILEVLYATGIRRSECIRLHVHDIDIRYGSLLVREGKNQKDRLVPLGHRAGDWLQRYLHDVRPELQINLNEHTLFLTDYGEPYGSSAFANKVKRYLRAAGIDKPGTCHLFRHAMATHMLNNGADIRFIQTILGHSKLTTTEIYTQVSIDKLKDIHAATHPAGRKTAPIKTPPSE